MQKPASFSLPLNPGSDSDRQRGLAEVHQFRADLSIRNASWFCRLRWMIIAILSVAGVMGLFSQVSISAGFKPNPGGFLATAVLLCVCNLGYLLHIRKVRETRRSDLAEWNLRTQIAIDIAVLTVVVHFLGSIETFAPFIYLLHIVLACIFFPRLQSMIIMLLAFGMYLGCLALEASGALSSGNGIYADPGFRMSFTPLQIITNTVTVFVIWGMIWFLASRLSRMIALQSRELAITNQRLIRTQTEKTKHMLRTTHELKAPFAAIHANAQLLLNGYCGSFSPEALAVIRRISERSEALSTEIQAMLQLANLTSVSKESLKWNRFDICDVLRRAIDSLEALATEKHVTIAETLSPILVFGVEDHLLMLFTNLISNAIIYSNAGGRVEISTAQEGADCVVRVADHGIGIHPDKISRIFEDHYRTEEAAAHNKASSGLGLAIVRNVAQKHQIPITVESTQGEGTRFTVRIPLLNKELNSQAQLPGIKRMEKFVKFLKGA